MIERETHASSEVSGVNYIYMRSIIGGVYVAHCEICDITSSTVSHFNP
jgi:hypothetical protein